MPSRSSKDHDFATVGRHTVEKLIGEKLIGEPVDDPNVGKNPAAVAHGKLGGGKGRKARAESLRQQSGRQSLRKRLKLGGSVRHDKIQFLLTSKPFDNLRPLV